MKYALFDCDGTLVDSMPMWLNLAQDVLATYGVDLPREVERETASMSHEDAAKFYADTFLDGKGADELAARFTAVLEENYREKLMLKPHVREVLEALHAKGVPMAVASSTDAYLLEMCLKRLGLRDYFRFVQTVDNSGFSKNSDAYFQRACAELGCAPADVLFFDDALYALERAKKNGLTTVAVQDDTQMDHDAEIHAAGDYYINDFSEVDIDAWFF
ncbi:MAG: HAD family phosphatase [Peptococcaceae bacterium]|nr:HAD family phosphatase [Peptococcaceae bacterium]